MVFFKKAFNLYQQTAALLVVLIVLTGSVLYIGLNGNQTPLSQETSQTPQSKTRASLPKESPYISDPDQLSIATLDTQSGGDCTATSEAIDAEEQKMIDLINDYRAQNNLGEIAINLPLNKAAAWMAEDMAAKHYLNHTDSLGRDPLQRFLDCGYSYPTVGENSAVGPTTQGVFDAWLTSPGHRANILRSSWRSMGIARANSGAQWYWTNDFSGETVNNPPPVATATPTPSELPTTTPVVIPSASPTSGTTPTSTPSPTENQSPNDSKIAFDISLTGIGANTLLGQNPDPVRKTLDLNIEIYDLQNQKIKEAHGSVIFNLATSSFKGEVPFGSLQSGSYKVKIKLQNSLARFIPEIVTINSNQTQTSNTKLILGDLDGDNELSVSDYNLMSGCYEKTQCGQKEIADLNLDGKVDELDLNVLYAGFANRKGD